MNTIGIKINGQKTRLGKTVGFDASLHFHPDSRAEFNKAIEAIEEIASLPEPQYRISGPTMWVTWDFDISEREIGEPNYSITLFLPHEMADELPRSAVETDLREYVEGLS